jgi:hypothetical protein
MEGQRDVYETSSFVGQPAFFGVNLHGSGFSANLYLPPINVDPTLCDISSLITESGDVNRTVTNITESDTPQSATQPYISRHKSRRLRGNDDMVHSDVLALLVRRGECDFVTKALNVMAINDLYGESGVRIEIVIVYNYIDSFEPGADSTFFMHYDEDRAEEASSVDLRLVAIDYSSGMYMNETMMLWHKSDISPKPNSPFLDESAFLPFGDEMRSKWFFPVSFNFDNEVDRSGARSLLFIMIVITALFPLSRVLLICFGSFVCRPRRNDSGRITGIEWSRRHAPTGQWSENMQMFQFIFQQNPNDQSHTLTLEEVNTLPTILYGVDDLHNTLEKYKRSRISGNDDCANDGDHVIHSIESEEDLSADRKRQPDDIVHAAFESSTSCSICICDFELNEKVMLLPLCKHIFHTECITPWLTEKKRSCPLCSRTVLEVGNSPERLGGIAAVRHYEETGVLRHFPFGIADQFPRGLDPVISSLDRGVGDEPTEPLNVQELVTIPHQYSSAELHVQDPVSSHYQLANGEENVQENVPIQHEQSEGGSNVQEPVPTQSHQSEGGSRVQEPVPIHHEH